MLPFDVASYTITLDDVSFKNGPNYVSTYATLTVRNSSGNYITTMNPEKRFFPTNSTTTTEAAIDNGLTRDLYIVLGAKQTSNSWVVRTYLKRFINWIWIGAAVLAFGGLLSLFDKRLRLGFVANEKAVLSN